MAFTQRYLFDGIYLMVSTQKYQLEKYQLEKYQLEKYLLNGIYSTAST